MLKFGIIYVVNLSKLKTLIKKKFMGFYILIGIISLASWLVSQKLKSKFKFDLNNLV